MWSHTIKSSAPNSTKPATERPARTGINLKKEDDVVTASEESMTQGFDADGFSKTSKVHASKKPLTVAKAPSFGRTTSRAGQTATSGTDPPRKDSPNKSTPPVKRTQSAKAGTPARVPRTATPTQSSSRASKAGTTLQIKLPVISHKNTPSGRRLTSTSTQNEVPSPSSESVAPGLDTHKPDGLGETQANDELSKDENGADDVLRAIDVQDHQRSEGLKHTIAVKDGEIRDLHAEMQQLHAQIRDIQTTNERKNEETKAAFLAQIVPLESEVDDSRKKISDLEATHRKTQEKHNKVLSLKDEEIQRLSEAAHGQRGEQEGKESVFSPKGKFQGLHIRRKRELDEAAAIVLATIESIQAERDELVQSRDQEIKGMSDLSSLVLELQENVEKARQADKDELKEAKTRNEQELVGKVEQELRDATTRYEELQEKVHRLEQELRNAAAKLVQESNAAKEERQTILRDANQKHEQESRDTASKYQQEIEALIAKNEEELETAATRQEQAFGDAAAKYQRESQFLEAKHLEELRTATTRDEQASGTFATKHQHEIQAMTAKHQEELGEIVTTNEQALGNAAMRSQQAIEAIIAKHTEGLASATSQIEELSAVIKRHQQELGDVATGHKQKLERVDHEYQQELRGVIAKYDQELEEAEAKYKALEDGSLKKEGDLREAAQKHEEETARLHNQLETAAGNVASLGMTLRDLNLQKEDSSRQAALKYEQELQTATIEYEEELQSLRAIYATAVEEIAALERALQDEEQKQSEALEEETQSLRIIYATASEEFNALRRTLEDVDQERSEAVDEATSLKASLIDLNLKRSEAVGQLTSLQGFMRDQELERSEAAVEIALLRDKLELADRRFEQDQQAVSDLQRQIRDLQAQIDELSTDTNFDQSEAAVDAALLKDKLELADLEIHLHKGTISALQNEIERLNNQLVEYSADTNLDRNEAVVDVALLKDKLELADIQIRQAKGTVSNLREEIEGLKAQITDSVGMDLDQNEAAVDIASLKHTLQLANLESHQDKATITTLQKQIEGLQAQLAVTPKTGSYPRHQLREELSMLGRHQAAQMTDLESLKADMAAESKLCEQEWKKRADLSDQFADELQGINTQLVGTVDGVSSVGSVD